MDAHPILLVVLFSLLYFPLTVRIANVRAFWYDELGTVYFAAAPDASAIRHLLVSSGDLQPLPFYLVTQASQKLFGRGELGTRMPAVIGFWVMCVSLFALLRRYVPVHWAALGLLLPCLTYAYPYAYEARPYGMLLGLSALVVLLWLRIASGNRRWYHFAMFGLALAGATSIHHYAVVLVIVIGCGELARLWTRKAPDWPVWTVAALACLPVVFNFGLVRAGIANFAAYSWNRPRLTNLVGMYAGSLSNLEHFAIILTLVLAWCLLSLDSPAAPPAALMRNHELAVATGLILAPVIAFVVAELYTKMIHVRYVIEWIVGLSWLLVLLLRRAAHGSPAVALLMTLLLSGYFGLYATRTYQQFSGARASMLAVISKVPEMTSAAGNETLPLVVEDPFIFLQWHYYCPPGNRSRFIYAADPESAVRYVGFDSVDINLLRVRASFGLPVERARDFRAAHPRYLLFHTDDFATSYLLKQLTDEGEQIEVLRREGSGLLVLVTRRSQGGPK